MMSNFDFLTEGWDEFSADAKAMEKLVRFDPKAACARALSDGAGGSVDVRKR